MNGDIWGLICEMGLWLWVFAAVGFILSSFPSRDSFRKGPAAVWGGCLILFFAFWIAGMLNA